MENARAVLANHPGNEWCGSVGERAIGSSTAWAAAITRTAALAFALSLSLAFSLTLALALAGSLALALAPSGAGAVADSVVRANAAIGLLALFLAGGAFRFGLRRTAVSATAAASLCECGACG